MTPAQALYVLVPEAFICLEDDCRAVFLMGAQACPGCASKQFVPLARWLDRDQEGGQ